MADDFFNDIKIPPEFDFVKRNLKPIVTGIIVVVLAFGSFFQIGTEEIGVITQFGKYIRTVEPGLNFKVPFVEAVIKVPVQRQHKLSFGIREGEKYDNRSRESRDEALMLTGDLNLADVGWVVQYRIKDPEDYLFKVRNPENSLRDISEAAMRLVNKPISDFWEYPMDAAKSI